MAHQIKAASSLDGHFHRPVFAEAGAMRLDAVMLRLLTIAAVLKGVWPDAAMLRREVASSVRSAYT